eukprot:6018899-Pleurochrysis_carterae.AAC.1
MPPNAAKKRMGQSLAPLAPFAWTACAARAACAHASVFSCTSTPPRTWSPMETFALSPTTAPGSGESPLVPGDAEESKRYRYIASCRYIATVTGTLPRSQVHRHSDKDIACAERSEEPGVAIAWHTWTRATEEDKGWKSSANGKGNNAA